MHCEYDSCESSVRKRDDAETGQLGCIYNMTAMRFDLRMSFDILMSFDLLRSSGSCGFCCACQIARHAPPGALANLENHQWLLSFNTARSKIIKSRDMCCYAQQRHYCATNLCGSSEPLRVLFALYKVQHRRMQNLESEHMANFWRTASVTSEESLDLKDSDSSSTVLVAG